MHMQVSRSFHTCECIDKQFDVICHSSEYTDRLVQQAHRGRLGTQKEQRGSGLGILWEGIL